MKTTISLLLIFITNTSFAAGDSPSSLIPAFVNVFLLVSLLIYFLRKPASEMFTSKSATVSEMLERASTKAKEAEMMMAAQKKKADGVEAEVKKMETESETLVKEFESQYSSEVVSRIASMKDDAGQKIEAEKKEMLNELNSNLLSLVVEKAKSQIKSDKSLADSATKNMVKGL
jgi:F0F1-type ATP synthase membrane subunit b/b'